MKNNFKKKLVVAGLSVSLLGGIGLNSTAILGLPQTAGVTAEAATSAKDVKDFKEFESALQNASVTEINVKGNITFKKNVTNIPARNLTINGNKEQGYIIDSGHYSIYGKNSSLREANEGKNNIFSIINANLIGNQADGRFFTGGSGNGPSSYGWDVFAKDVKYEGARFVHLSEGKLTFDGKNEIDTRAENAWVHDLEFLEGSEYNGSAAGKDHGQFSAFYFNGRLIDGKATGKVEIGGNAKVNIEISKQSDVNYYYPAFYDKVYQVNVGDRAELNVNAAGVAFQFIPRADYKNVPSLNLGKNTSVKFNGRGGGKYQSMKIQQYGTQINQDTGSELKIYGNSNQGVVESIYEFAGFNLYGAKNLDIANKKPNSPLFRGDRTFVQGYNESQIKTWSRDGGKYPESDVKDRFSGNRYFNTYVGLYGDAKDNDVSAEFFGYSKEASEKFQMADYGRVVFQGTAANSGEID
ncbi:MAG: hypothetical protein RR659_05690 [Bacilli bacterium]